MGRHVEVKVEAKSPEPEKKRDLPLNSLASTNEIVELKEEIRKIKDAYNKTTKENQDLRTSIQKISADHESREAGSSAKFRLLQLQIDKAMTLIQNMGGRFVPPNFAQNTFTRPPPLFPPQWNLPRHPNWHFQAANNNWRPQEYFNRNQGPPALLQPTFTQNPNCIFCRLGKHDSYSCLLYKYREEKLAVIQNRNLCLKCLEPLHNVRFQRHIRCSQNCSRCNDIHHNLLCERRTPSNGIYICVFCNNRTHDTKECVKYFIGTSASHRKLKMFTENRCFHCLEKNDQKNIHSNCSNKLHVCQLCVNLNTEKAPHHPLLCESFYDYRQADAPQKMTRKLAFSVDTLMGIDEDADDIRTGNTQQADGTPSVGVTSETPSVGVTSETPSVGVTSETPSVGVTSETPSVGVTSETVTEMLKTQEDQSMRAKNVENQVKKEKKYEYKTERLSKQEFETRYPDEYQIAKDQLGHQFLNNCVTMYDFVTLYFAKSDNTLACAYIASNLTACFLCVDKHYAKSAPSTHLNKKHV